MSEWERGESAFRVAACAHPRSAPPLTPAHSSLSAHTTGALHEICNSDALSIVEQSIFDAAYSLVKYASAGVEKEGERRRLSPLNHSLTPSLSLIPSIHS